MLGQLVAKLRVPAVGLGRIELANGAYALNVSDIAKEKGRMIRAEYLVEPLLEEKVVELSLKIRVAT